jgi:hypothetical protein
LPLRHQHDGGRRRCSEYRPGAELHAVSCAFTGNHADDDGGGAYNDFDSITSYSNCTFTQNTAGFSGDGMYNASSDPDILNSILWNNNGLSTSNQLAGGSPVVDYSCLPGGWGSPNNISADPLFVDPDGPDDIPGTLDDDLRLAAGSPCIDSGSSGLLPADTTDADLDGDVGEPTPIDVAGHARVLCGGVDIGAHESGIGDVDCDGSVDLTDYQQWSGCMTGPNLGPYAPGCHLFDFELDHDVDFADYAAWQRLRGAP